MSPSIDVRKPSRDREESKMNSKVRILGPTLVFILIALLAGTAQAAEVKSFTAGLSNYQAGGHPDVFTSFEFELAPSTNPPGSCELAADGVCMTVKGGAPKDIVIDLPKGMTGNLRAVGTCKFAQLNESHACPQNSEIGYMDLKLIIAGSEDFFGNRHVSIYNMTPERGDIARFGAKVLAINTYITVAVDSSGDYRVTTKSENIFSGLVLYGADIVIWGSPEDPMHDASRECMQGNGCNLPLPRDVKPFIVAPMQCGVDGFAEMRVNTYQRPDEWEEAKSEPQQVTGCDKLTFDPTFEVQPAESDADAPTGLDIRLGFPQHFDSPGGVETPPLKDAKVVFPEGMTINPASADGLVACPDDQLRLRSDLPFECPLASKIGFAEANTPVLEEPLKGGLYLRPQASADPQSGEMFRLALVLENEERGLSVRLPGRVRANPVTGRLEATFDDNPQLPVAAIDLRLKDGPRAPLALPPTCGEHKVEALLTAWSGHRAHLSDSFNVRCPGASSFAPKLSAGVLNPLAGDLSPFVARIERGQGEELLSGVRLDLPPGLLAQLKGVALCPENLAGGSADAPCPAASRIGTATTGAGSGNPLSLPGSVYLTGPYKGAPFGLSVQVPAKAGPFDLGMVKVRQALRVDPVTAQVTVISDPLPQVVGGVPVRLRTVDVEIDRSGFTLNPTSCKPMQVGAELTSTAGVVYRPQRPFQVADCATLGFKPKLALRLSGAPPRRGGYPKLTATLTMPKKGANIGKAVVMLPETEFLENAHIRTICTRVQYAAENCPKGSVYGYAKAWTPLLDKPLQGPVYLRSSNHTLPDLVASLDGQIHIDLAGRIDSPGGRIRNTFWAVPDAPVSKFVLTMQGGRKGLLANNTNLCAADPRASVSFTGQNGKVSAGNPKVKVAGCGKKQRK